jgi:hypothetical protein
VLDCAFHLRPHPASTTPSIFVPAREGCYVGIVIIELFLSVCKQFFSCKRSIVLELHLSCNLTANFSELFTNIRPRLRIIPERILNHYNSRESNSNLPIRIRIEIFHFSKFEFAESNIRTPLLQKPQHTARVEGIWAAEKSIRLEDLAK